MYRLQIRYFFGYCLGNIEILFRYCMATAINLKSIFPGSSEMAQQMRAFDWTRNELGPPENWPEALKTSVRIILTSRHPMFIWWGDKFINLHNDGYANFLHSKHPDALGKPACFVWPEIWHDLIVPRIEAVKHQDGGTFEESMPFVNLRRGYPELTYATFSISPILNEEGQFGGILCPVSEETDRIIGQRQVELLRQLAAKTLGTHNRKEACRLASEALQTNTDDIPFALFYELNIKTGVATLEAAMGVAPGTKLAPKQIKIDEESSESVWPLSEVFTNNDLVLVSDLKTASLHLPIMRGQYLGHYPINQVIALPLSLGVEDRKAALIIGLSPLRPWDDNYREFLHLVSAGISSAIQNADAYEVLKQRAGALTEPERAKIPFCSNDSHEFCTPLTLILGPQEDILAETEDSHQHDERLELIRCNALRMQKLGERALRESEVSFRALVLASSAMVYQMNADWSALIGFKSKNSSIDNPRLPCKNWLEIYIPKDEHKRLMEAISSAIHNKNVYENEHRFFKADGSEGWVFSCAVPLMNSKNEIVEWFGAATDITERKSIEQAFKDTARRKDEFLAILSHELRNPLFPLKNAIFLLQNREDNDPDHQQKLIQMMERQVNHLVRLADDLLDVARVTTGKIELRKELISLVDVINNAIEAANPLIVCSQHKLCVSLPSEALIVNADMVRMTQVFVNLLNNAVKFTKKQGIITITVHREDETAVVSIRDNGIGISSTMLPQIFEMFTQDKGTLCANYSGLGIGLSMVSELVNLHGGTVTANSAGYDLGSEFIVKLPLWVDAS